MYWHFIFLRVTVGREPRTGKFPHAPCQQDTRTVSCSFFPCLLHAWLVMLPGIPHLVMFLILAEPQFSVLVLTSLKEESVLCGCAGPHHSTV